MIRSVAEYFNQRLAEWTSESGVHFIDVEQEGFAGHNLCASEEDREFINGFVVDVSRGSQLFNSSFHPNRHGHDMKGRALAGHLGDLDWDGMGGPAPDPDQTPPPDPDQAPDSGELALPAGEYTWRLEGPSDWFCAEDAGEIVECPAPTWTGELRVAADGSISGQGEESIGGCSHHVRICDTTSSELNRWSA